MNKSDNDRSQINFSFLILYWAIICVIIVAVLLYFSFYAATAESRSYFGMALALSGVFMMPIFFFLFIFSLNHARVRKILSGDYFVRWEYPKNSGKGDVYFCSEGVYDADKPNKALDTFGNTFLGAEIPSDDPSVIRFSNRQYTGSRFETTLRTQDVAIPHGKEEEAKELVERFREYSGRRSKYSRDQWRYVLPLIGIILIWFFAFFQFAAMPAGLEAKKDREQQTKEYLLQENKKEITPLWNKIRQTLEPKIEQLKTLPDGKLTAKEAGFDENSEVLTVLHGRCANDGFYVSVVLKKGAIRKSYNGNETGAFNYIANSPIPTNPTENFCKPMIQDYFEDRILLSDGWVYGEVIIRPYLPTTSPTANSQTNKNGK